MAKMKDFATKKAYTLDELYERIKDKAFSAGKPALVKQMGKWIIVFPPLDKNNQIWLRQRHVLKKPPYDKWSLIKSDFTVGMKGVLSYTAKSYFFGAVGTGALSKTTQISNHLLDITEEELAKMDL